MFNFMMFLFVLIFIDLIFSLVFPHFYVKIGIPVIKKNIKTEKVIDKSQKIIALKTIYLDKFHCKTDNNNLWFRTKYNLINLYSLAILFSLKGEIEFCDDRIKLSVYISNYNIIFLLLLIGCLFLVKLDSIGIIMLIVFTIILIGITLIRILTFNKTIKEIQGDILL
jgi:hypothetical protein